MTSLSPLLEEFFTERLIAQRHVSPNTIASYRDTFRLLLSFAHDTLGKRPCQLDLTDLDAALVSQFLAHLEIERGVSVRTRNARLTAIRSMFQFASFRHPEHGSLISRVLSIPPKRTDELAPSALSSAPEACGRHASFTCSLDPSGCVRGVTSDPTPGQERAKRGSVSHPLRTIPSEVR